MGAAQPRAPAPASPALPTVPLFAAPAAVLVSATRGVSVESVRVALPVPQVIDWKCASRSRGPEVRRQLAIHALVVRERFGLRRHPEAGCAGRVVDLSSHGGRRPRYSRAPARDTAWRRTAPAAPHAHARWPAT